MVHKDFKTRACSNKEMKIIIVNNKDEVVGLKEREDLDATRDIYRVWRIRLIMLPFIRILQTENLGQRVIQLSKFSVSALWIVNNKDNKVLLAKRAFTKKQHPGKWGTAVAGTVEEGESYESNIIKEAEEELGIRNIKPEKAIKEFVTGKHKHFTQWFFLKSDIELDELKVNADEVAEVGWFSMEEFLDLIKNNLAVTLTKELLQRIRTIND